MPEEPHEADQAGDESSVASLAARFADAWNAHDPRAFAGLFAPDADFTNVAGVRVTGRANIERLHARVFATVFRDSQLSIQATRTRPLGNDLLAADVTWSMIGARTADEQPRGTRHGVMGLVVRVRGQAAEIVIMHNIERSAA